jgi:hypothetical protein
LPFILPNLMSMVSPELGSLAAKKKLFTDQLSAMKAADLKKLAKDF